MLRVLAGGRTSEADDGGAVEVQQGGEGAAICAVLQEVVHRGDPGNRPGQSLLLPIPCLEQIDIHQWLSRVKHIG